MNTEKLRSSSHETVCTASQDQPTASRQATPLHVLKLITQSSKLWGRNTEANDARLARRRINFRHVICSVSPIAGML
jgi:hypothetical protein